GSRSHDRGGGERVSTTGYGGVQPSLFTDLYELTMAAAYFANGRTGRATFELSVRSLPANRNFLVACGLEDLLQALASWRFSDDDIAYLRTLDLFDEPFLDALRAIEFTGDVRAVPEGEVVFAASRSSRSPRRSSRGNCSRRWR